MQIVCVLFVILMKLAALAYAAHDSVRARFWPGVAALVAIAALWALWLEGLLPLEGGLRTRQWLPPLFAFALSIVPTALAFRRAAQLREDDPQHVRLERAGFGFLASVLIDAALLVIVVLVILVVARE